MRRRRIRSSISIPITLGAITVLLSIALLIGWSVLLGQKIMRSVDIAGDVWLLVLGAVSFVLIIVVLVLFVISLARGIIEVRKQDSFIDSVTHELKSPLASLQLCLETLGREGLEKEATGERGDREAARHDARRRRPSARVYRRRPRGEPFILRASGHAEPQRRITLAARRAVCRGRSRQAQARARRGAHRRRSGDHRVDRSFHRFYRVEDQDVRERRGTGLGLFVVWALVKQLGGKVQALSEGRGQGTIMRVELPVTPVESG